MGSLEYRQSSLEDLGHRYMQITVSAPPCILRMCVVARRRSVHMQTPVGLLHVRMLSPKPFSTWTLDFVAAAIDQNGHRVMMHGDSICCLFGVLCFRLNWYVTLTLEDDSRKKLIKKQHNHLLIAETFLYQLPLVGRFFQSTVPRVSAVCFPLTCPSDLLQYATMYTHPAFLMSSQA